MAQLAFAQHIHGTNEVHMPKTRLPSLRTQHGEGCDWSRYEAEWHIFKPWLKQDVNMERTGSSYESEESIQKINRTLQEVLIHRSLHYEEDGEPLTMEWLLGSFNETFVSYAKYLQDRPVEFSTISKQLTDLKNPLEWATKHRWPERGVLKSTRALSLITKLDTLQSHYAKASKKEKRRRQEVDGTPPPAITLQEFWGVVQALEDELLVRLNGVDSAEISNADKLEVAECLLMKLACRGNRGVDLMRIYIGQDVGTVKQWLHDDNVDADDVVLVKRPSWQLIVVSSKKHFLHHELNEE